MASMFHKPVKKELSAAVERKPRPRVPRPRPPKPEADLDEDTKPPAGTFTDYQVISSSLGGWKYDIMKFDSRGKEVDLNKWNAPVKLNRKDYRPPNKAAQDEAVPIELKAMVGPDGKPVIGPDGKVVMVGPDGKVPQGNGVVGKQNGKDAAKGKGKGKQMFKKKTKQVFLVPDEVKQLRREERYPWVLEESGDNGQVWVGHIENPEKALTHGLLVPKGPQFQFVPCHRWYKFQKRPTYRILALEEAEAEYAKTQKNKDPERWLMRRKAANGRGPSDATLATLKADSERRLGSAGPSGEGIGLRTVDDGPADLFGDDDEEEKMNKRRRDKEMGEDGDIDEMEYEADFADDEENVEMDGDDEETKEMEERLKREYRTANKLRDGHIDEDEEEEEEELTGAGKALKKLVKKTEKNEAYDSDDDDKDPYISEEEEPEENIPSQPSLNEPAVINQSQPQPSSGTTTPTPARPGSGAQTPRPPKPKAKPSTQPHSPPSRANSPGLGNAVVAKRATSPKAPKQKAISGGSGHSRAVSPLAGGSRAASPVPPANVGTTSGSRPATPATSTDGPPLPTQSLKRKAFDDPPTPSGAADGGKPRKKAKRPLEESMIIAFLREKAEVTTKDCIQKFQPYLKEEETKRAFTAMVKKVAMVKNSLLKLRPEYQ
ncbi:hypothetical protein JB92DRAFT_2959193 [Gautieria morchelliformis]|nr:hypothetical protein JB92DRAFT_2959193 [Gautieria morchelliformis]